MEVGKSHHLQILMLPAKLFLCDLVVNQFAGDCELFGWCNFVYKYVLLIKFFNGK